jgi:hypothetical protein
MNITPFTVGVRTNYYDYNATVQCLQHGLIQEYKPTCRDIPGMFPVVAASLMFFQVCTIKMYIHPPFQGLPFHPHSLNMSTGARQENGTWTGALGALQSGVVDIFASNILMTLERQHDFHYTNAFTIDKYAALLKRQTDLFEIDINSLTVGIDLSVYGLLFVTLAGLFLVSFLNERLQCNTNRNSSWRLCLSLFPCNGEMWKHKSGVTRKILMATSGFAIIILSSLYQAKYAEWMMIPYEIPVVTLKNIENYLSSGSAKLLFPESNIETLGYLSHVSTSISKSLQTNPPIFVANFDERIKLIQTQNGIEFNSESVLLNYLNHIDPDLCESYVYVSLNEWAGMYHALIMNKGKREMLQNMNTIVAERMSFVDDYIQSYKLNEKCRKHIFPVYSPTPYYSGPLLLAGIGGPFVFLISLLSLSFCVFLLEMYSTRWMKKEEVLETFELPALHYDSRTSLHKRELIEMEYAKLRSFIETIE